MCGLVNTNNGQGLEKQPYGHIKNIWWDKNVLLDTRLATEPIYHEWPIIHRKPGPDYNSNH